jgi:hypothetical protein
MLNGWDRRSSVLSATATGAGRSGNSVAQREALHLGAGRPASKENLKKGFLVLAAGHGQCGDAPQQTAPLFDHLVGAGEQRRRHGEAEGLGSFEVNHQLEFGRLLDRQIGGLRAL